MIARDSLVVAYRIAPICRHTRMRFIDHAWRKVSTGVASGDPVRSERHLAAQRLLDPELFAAPHRLGREHVLTRDIAARRQPRFVDRLAYCQIAIAADAV